MSPRHFSNYRNHDPKGYQTFSDNMHNAFVSVTHLLGLGKFFSFTPAVLPAEKRAGSEEKPIQSIGTHKHLYK
jgi:hypothetical protein